MKRPRKPEKVCDICGYSGDGDSIATCCRCKKSFEHLYCMRTLLYSIPTSWFCEECRSRDYVLSPESDVTEYCSKGPVSGMIPNDAMGSLAAGKLNPKTATTDEKYKSPVKRKFSHSKDCNQLSGTQKMLCKSPDLDETQGVPVPNSPCKKYLSGLGKCYNEVKSAKVKCLPLEEIHARRLGGLAKQVGEKALAVPKKEHLCNEDLVEFRISTNEMGKPVGEAFPPCLFTECQRITEPKKEHLCNKDLVESIVSTNEMGHTFRTNVEERVQPMMLLKFPEEKLLNPPIQDAIWRGSFETTTMVGSRGIFYDEILGHIPSKKVSDKVKTLSKKMPKNMQFKILPRCDVFPKLFKMGSPTEHDIALYYFPGDLDRSIQKYRCLLETIERDDLAMQSWLDDVELLIFTSKQLPMDSQSESYEGKHTYLSVCS